MYNIFVKSLVTFVSHKISGTLSAHLNLEAEMFWSYHRQVGFHFFCSQYLW